MHTITQWLSKKMKEASCVEAFDESIRTDDGSANSAKAALSAYCTTSAGRVDPICGCYNVSDSTLNCGDAKYNCTGSSGSTACPSGCGDYNKLKKQLEEVGAAAAFLSSVTSNSICYQPACLGSNSATLIRPDSNKTHVCDTTIVACINTFSNNNYSNSSVSVTCQNTLGIDNSSGGNGGGNENPPSNNDNTPFEPQSTPPPKETTNISLIIFIILAILSAIGIVVSFYL
jgi:hypothetical protein